MMYRTSGKKLNPNMHSTSFCSFYLLQDASQREQILKIVLSVEHVAPDVDYKAVAEGLINFSGSDIREMCRHASVSRVHEAIKSGK